MAHAEKDGHKVASCIVVSHLTRLSAEGSKPADYDAVIEADWRAGRDTWWHEDMKGAAAECESNTLVQYVASNR